MSMPLRVSLRIGTHLMKQKLSGNKKFPLLVELRSMTCCFGSILLRVASRNWLKNIQRS